MLARIGTATARTKHPVSTSKIWKLSTNCYCYSTQAPQPEDLVVLAANKLISSPALQDSANKKQQKQLQDIKTALDNLKEHQDLVKSLENLSINDPDPDLRSLAELDLPDALSSLSLSRSQLLTLVLPPSSLDTSSLSAILEVKSAVGGSESALFAGELVRMYSRLAVRKGWKPVVVESVGVPGVGMGSSSGDAIKEAILEVNGEGAFAFLKREAGVHRVQRVPQTESQGRVHTSTASVIVLPSESNSAPTSSSDDLFDPKDVKVEVMRSRGAGGQHVNKTESAIRLTHAPTGITVSMQDSRSQHENRTKAYRVLRARLMDRKLQQEILERRSVRRNQVRGADRSEKVRTYNFPQGRVTDHRISLTVSGLEDALEGGETLDLVNRELEAREEQEALEGVLAGED
ncbi:release factor [Meredithblackwellia eburnea MCA 4105]